MKALEYIKNNILTLILLILLLITLIELKATRSELYSKIEYAEDEIVVSINDIYDELRSIKNAIEDLEYAVGEIKE